MNIVCLDMEGVLVPEIWIAFAEASGIPELKKTTRDEPDYDTRTPDTRFWRPVLYQLSYSRKNQFPTLRLRTDKII